MKYRRLPCRKSFRNGYVLSVREYRRNKYKSLANEKRRKKRREKKGGKVEAAIKLGSRTWGIPFSLFLYYAVTLTSPNPFKTAGYARTMKRLMNV